MLYNVNLPASLMVGSSSSIDKSEDILLFGLLLRLGKLEPGSIKSKSPREKKTQVTYSNKTIISC